MVWLSRRAASRLESDVIDCSMKCGCSNSKLTGEAQPGDGVLDHLRVADGAQRRTRGLQRMVTSVWAKLEAKLDQAFWLLQKCRIDSTSKSKQLFTPAADAALLATGVQPGAAQAAVACSWRRHRIDAGPATQEGRCVWCPDGMGQIAVHM